MYSLVDVAKKAEKKLKDPYRKSFLLLELCLRYAWVPLRDLTVFLQDALEKLLQAQKEGRSPEEALGASPEEAALLFQKETKRSWPFHKRFFESVRLVPLALFFYSMTSLGISWVGRGIFQKSWSMNHQMMRSDGAGLLFSALLSIVMVWLMRQKPLLFLTQGGAVSSFLRSILLVGGVVAVFAALPRLIPGPWAEVNVALFLSGLLLLTLIFKQLEKRMLG